MLLFIETILVVVAIGLAFLSLPLGERLFSPAERYLARLARHRMLSVVAVGATALGLRILLMPLLPVPEPAVHDEFSYLLAADTFAHGRLANPTHPMWVHFETFHVNQKPKYVSMYYPAQGVFLAVGQVLFGHPFWGVWLSTGLMCAAICWMLQGWMPAFWALLGGFLAVIRLGTFSYWMNSYWGGSVAALGGALVLGALPRIKRYQRVRDAVLMGIGFALLANSRPYEGLVLAVAVGTLSILWMRRYDIRLRGLSRIAIPLTAILVLTLGFMAYYFLRTTGNPLRTPYFVNTSAYRPVPFFPWQPLTATPVYQNETLRSYYLGWALNQYHLARQHVVIAFLFKAFKFWLFYLGPALTLPLFAACFVLPFGIKFRDLSQRSRSLLLICGFVFAAAALPVCFEPHYIAPATSVFYALVLITLQRVRHWRPADRPVGIALTRAVVGVVFVTLVAQVFAPIDAGAKLATWYAPVVLRTYRTEIAATLNKRPGLHLAIVRYSSKHIPADEWVYNRADIDHAKIIWARDMGIERNQELVRYFNNREAWLVEADERPPQICNYRENQHGCNSMPPEPSRALPQTAKSMDRTADNNQRLHAESLTD